MRLFLGRKPSKLGDGGGERERWNGEKAQEEREMKGIDRNIIIQRSTAKWGGFAALDVCLLQIFAGNF